MVIRVFVFVVGKKKKKKQGFSRLPFRQVGVIICMLALRLLSMASLQLPTKVNAHWDSEGCISLTERGKEEGGLWSHFM